MSGGRKSHSQEAISKAKGKPRSAAQPAWSAAAEKTCRTLSPPSQWSGGGQSTLLAAHPQLAVRENLFDVWRISNGGELLASHLRHECPHGGVPFGLAQNQSDELTGFGDFSLDLFSLFARFRPNASGYCASAGAAARKSTCLAGRSRVMNTVRWPPPPAATNARRSSSGTF